MGSLILILGGPFQIRERYLEGHFNKFHESNTKAVAKLKLNSTAANGTPILKTLPQINYSRTSRKRPPKMQRLSRRLREVVLDKN